MGWGGGRRASAPKGPLGYTPAMSLELQYYVDLPGRDLTIPDPNSVVWIDIEPGCFQDAQDVRDQGTANTAAGMRTGIYCNRYSLAPVFGDSQELAPWPLWLADYRPPDYQSFVPFNGWASPALWQWSSSGWMTPVGLINADVSITPEGRVFVDISNFTSLGPKEAQFLKYTVDGVVIGLQNAAIARQQKALLS